MTTYVLGAGASHHAGYPLANRLGDALVRWLVEHCSPVNDMYGANIKALHELYGGLDDMDRIMTELDDCPPGSRAEAMDAVDRREAKKNIRIMIPEFFRALQTKPAPLYERLALERIKAGDVVITFNYDVSCERELRRAGLWEISDGYGFNLEIDAITSSRERLLKLHGSANWLEVAFGGMTGFFQGPPNAFGNRPVIFPGEFAFLGYPAECRDPLTPPGSAGAFPAIIVPGLNKHFYERTSAGRELEAFWESLWINAENALMFSDRIVMIGYSMPTGDIRARRLVLEKSNRDALVEIYCGPSTKSISETFASKGFRRIQTSGNSYFEDHLRSSTRVEAQTA
jgi:hypothetical protein